ncbi:hypothetical protein M427DRAFT_148145 [Gonapodya prolifera JEL478]|uniref:RNA polymerase I associated factor, A49-like protein n=1 Tax=Gonapodya prolifera (strain JEL478) TaxID=1344416 RepID=A0A139A2S4_GONPJ|nr:hypothetical protein M427DRAFT_148145 [Gonapodya prolifera JEL478]|eukprot:KXS10999.1 hypothetical protein M427DRAFT_148145 [Gonapodya prolifera JEL478]
MIKSAANDDTGPHLASVPALHVDESSHFSLFGSIDSQRASKRRRLQIAGEGGRVAFTGTQVDGERYVVGLYDSHSNSLTLKEGDMFDVRMIAKPNLLVDSESQTVRSKNAIARTQLGETFGSRKRQQALRAYARNQVDTGATTFEVVDALNDQVQSNPESSSDDMASSVLPSCDQSATTVEQIYALDSIHPPAEVQQIPVLKFLRDTGEDPQRLCEDTSRSKDRLKRLIHTHYMLKMLSLAKMKFLDDPGKMRAKIGSPLVVFEGLTGRFMQLDAVTNAYSMPPKLQDKLCCYILAALLHLHGFKLNISEVSTSMKLPSKKLSELSSAMGLRLKTTRHVAWDSDSTFINFRQRREERNVFSNEANKETMGFCNTVVQVQTLGRVRAVVYLSTV